MPLEKLLAPVQWADEQVLRQYTKLTKRWEDKGHSRYTLSSIFNIGGWLISLDQTSIIDDIVDALHGSSFATDHLLKGYGDDSTVTSGAATIRSSPLRSIHRATRFPAFAASAAVGSLGAYELITGAYTGDQSQIREGLHHLQYAGGLFGLASSFYIKEADPKLLDREPVWKTAYNTLKEAGRKAKDRVGGWLPSPEPIPSPVFVPARRVGEYATLEAHVTG